MKYLALAWTLLMASCGGTPALAYSAYDTVDPDTLLATPGAAQNAVQSCVIAMADGTKKAVPCGGGAPYRINEPAMSSVVSGTPVSPFAALQLFRGGIIMNGAASGNLCVRMNPQGGALTAGTTTGGGTFCIAPSVTWGIPPTLGTISVNASTGTISFAAEGYQ